MLYRGSCHCGKVAFEVEAPAKLEALECNCSICKKSGFIHLILPKSDFTLLTDRDQLSNYTFNTHTAQHSFCKTCGIKPFYVPRSNPDGISVNLRCLDTPAPSVAIELFDGEHWEDNAHKIAHRSQKPDD